MKHPILGGALIVGCILFACGSAAQAGTVTFSDDFNDGDITDWSNRPIIREAGDPNGSTSHPLPTVSGGQVQGYGSGYNGVAPWMIQSVSLNASGGLVAEIKGQSGSSLMNQASMFLLDESWGGDWEWGAGYRFWIYGEGAKRFVIDRHDPGVATTTLASFNIGAAIHSEHTYTVSRDASGSWSLLMDGTAVSGTTTADLTYDRFGHVALYFNSEQSKVNGIRVDATAVPLPAGAWAGFILLAGLVAVRTGRRRGRIA